MNDTPYERLDAFIDDLLVANFDEAMERRPHIGDDAIAYVRARYITGEADGREPLEETDAFWGTLALIFSQADAAVRRRLLEEVVFEVSHPDAYRRLAPLLRAATFPTEVEDLLVDKLSTGTDLQRRNAHELEYYLFGFGGETYQMSAPARAEFDALAARRARSERAAVGAQHHS